MSPAEVIDVFRDAGAILDGHFILSSGLRSPAGLGVDLEGRLLATDNQGDWVASCPIYWLREGAFYGHPASLAWTDAYREAGRRPSDSILARARASMFSLISMQSK